VIYVIDHESKRIRILSVGHRSRIYSG